MKFDKSKWVDIEGGGPAPCREQMIEDLTKNHKLVGLKYQDLKILLGEPDGSDSVKIYYEVVLDFGHDIDPVYEKDLNFYFNKDSTVRKYEVTEWGKK